MENKQRAVVLLSGGLDSTTVLSVAKQAGYECHALSFNYGQRHCSELKAAKQIADYFSVASHKIFSLDLEQFGGSALTDKTLNVPDYQDNNAIPITYVPARNTIFLSIALGFAETLDANTIFIGVSSVDYSGYPDCRPEFIQAFAQCANLATKLGVSEQSIKIETPLMQLTKAQTIQLGVRSGVDYSLTVSCYRANEQGEACGRCDSCVLRAKGFHDAGITDPTCYYH